VGGQEQNVDTGQGAIDTGMPQMSGMPKPGEMPPGAEVQTPLGVSRQDPTTGAETTTLSPEGQQQFKMKKAALRKKLGPLPELLNAPGMPEFPVEVGQWNYNPFSGKMERE
jgi:hypothetical protein